MIWLLKRLMPSPAAFTERPITGKKTSTVLEFIKISLKLLSLRLTLSEKNLTCSKGGLRNCVITSSFSRWWGAWNHFQLRPTGLSGPSLDLSPSLWSRSPPKGQMLWSVTVSNVPPTPSHCVIYLQSQRYTLPYICASVHSPPREHDSGRRHVLCPVWP